MPSECSGSENRITRHFSSLNDEHQPSENDGNITGTMLVFMLFHRSTHLPLWGSSRFQAQVLPRPQWLRANSIGGQNTFACDDHNKLRKTPEWRDICVTIASMASSSSSAAMTARLMDMVEDDFFIPALAIHHIHFFPLIFGQNGNFKSLF
eukprot:TRINITY_DN3880_c0_g1_i1.p1 TRINITY_DN3880_c0_g1~~TRINITY_DN3880_c0_g1_i1.p1  ORF type:complete len:151 (-),score=24.99 TRINITY_DN3880_c0_g1_i1:221-673(-)